MRISKLPVLLFGAALLLSSSAFAAEANKGTLQLTDKVTVEGKPLNSGKYTVEWSGSGPEVQVTLLQGKQTVATFSAHLTEQASTSPQDAYGTATAPDGSRSLTAIYLAKNRVTLQLDQNAAS
jgi:hypothetical protein